MTDYDFRLVSPTALIPAFARGEQTDIPLAREVMQLLEAHGKDPSGPWGQRALNEYAPFFESRFKSINRAIDETGLTQILELAAGLSTRGMDYAQKGCIYLEADLPESTELKRQVVIGVLGNVPATLHLCAVNVVDPAALLACCAVFEPRPVAIATEGLLRYLTFDEKRQLVAGVREILSRLGGFWVTTDIHLRTWAQGHRRLVNRQEETERLGRNLEPNYFDDVEHAQSFFESCGFEVESRPLLEGIRDRIVSWDLASEELKQELQERRTFVLRVP